MSASKVSRTSSASTSKRKTFDAGFLDAYEREDFIAKLLSKRTGSFAALARKANISAPTLWKWRKGERIRRTTARSVRFRLGLSEYAQQEMDLLADALRGERDAKARRLIFWRVALLIAEQFDCVTEIALRPTPGVRIGSCEVLLLQFKNEPCYRVFHSGEAAFEGTLSQRLIPLLKEYMEWLAQQLLEKSKTLENINNYDRFIKNPPPVRKP